MSIQHKSTLLFILFSSYFFAQDVVQKDTVLKKEIKISYLDSIKKTFVVYKNATKIDSLWMKNMTSLNTYDQLLTDIKTIDVDQKVDFELPTELLKERLKKMDEKSPFNIEYNVGLENVIKSFLKNRKKTFERLMGISQFYFPLFEEELAKNNIPLEIKYLAVIESALNPRAVSHCGATGLWQFMYQTGKQYGLNINSYIDERNEPMASSKAASQYMTNMYKIFNDWDLVLAAYNSGPGNVAKAIRRSGGQQNYWNIRKNLPKETQGYLPAFLATMYIFEYHKEHGIVPNKAVALHFETDTVMVKKAMTFKQISNLLDIPEDELKFFNPSYKRNEIPYVSGETNQLTLPKDKIAIFTSNEDKIYAYLDYESSKRERPNQIPVFAKVKDSTAIALLDNDVRYINRTRNYTIRRGDDLTEIANKFGVNVWDLKKWNGLRSNKTKVGRNLKIISTERIAYKDKIESVKKDAIAESKPIENTIAEVSGISKSGAINKLEKTDKIYKTEKVTVNKDVTKTHKVKKGETLSGIADNYNVSISELKKWNKLKKDNVGLGKNLKIITSEKVVLTVKKEIKQVNFPIKEAVVIEQAVVKLDKTKKEDISELNKKQKYYTVESGDNLYYIAHKNNVTVQQLIDWNGLKDNNVNLGSQLIIPSEKVAQTDNIDVKRQHYTVGKGENLKSIAAKFHTSIKNLEEWNNLPSNKVDFGVNLIVSMPEEVIVETSKKLKTKVEIAAKEKSYYVKKGDSLFSISQKFPGVTISDLKRWNNIKGESLQAGMKLKING